MRVLVLGAGVVGVATAWFLTRAGHDVTVVERRDGVALETSRANAGLLTPAQSPPWNAPGVPWRALGWLLRRDAALDIRLRWDPAMIAWLLAFVRNSTPARHRRHAEVTLRLARFSMETMTAIEAEIAPAYDRTARGILTIFRQPEAMGAAARGAAGLESLGVAAPVLDRDACLAVEPALTPIATQIAGGVHNPDDRSGDVHKLATALAAAAARDGARFRHGVVVRGLTVRGARIAAVETDQGPIEADAVVVALGWQSRRLLAPLGLRLPLYPVQGYSVTIDIGDGAPETSDGQTFSGEAPVGPSLPVRDAARKMVVTPLGRRLRATGVAVLNGGDATIDKGHVRTLREALHALFPRVPRSATETPWTGLRPMTPDGPPVLGPTPYENLFLNTGHGPLGWTLAAGSGRLVAGLVDARPPEIPLDGLTLARYR